MLVEVYGHALAGKTSFCRALAGALTDELGSEGFVQYRLESAGALSRQLRRVSAAVKRPVALSSGLLGGGNVARAVSQGRFRADVLGRIEGLQTFAGSARLCLADEGVFHGYWSSRLDDVDGTWRDARLKAAVRNYAARVDVALRVVVSEEVLLERIFAPGAEHPRLSKYSQSEVRRILSRLDHILDELERSLSSSAESIVVTDAAQARPVAERLAQAAHRAA